MAKKRKKPENYPLIKREKGRPKREISADVQRIILTLIATGDSDNRVHKITGIRPEQWQQLADDNEIFRGLLDRAKDSRNGNLAAALRQSMIQQIGKGHPWWAKLAIHNYKTLLKDPDVKAAVKIKKLVDQMDKSEDEAVSRIRIRRVNRKPDNAGS